MNIIPNEEIRRLAKDEALKELRNLMSNTSGVSIETGTITYNVAYLKPGKEVKKEDDNDFKPA